MQPLIPVRQLPLYLYHHHVPKIPGRIGACGIVRYALIIRSKHSEGKALMDFIPERALVIAPHPDDAEVWAGGVIAKWTRAGAAVHYVLCTDGGKGTDDPAISAAELSAARIREQQAAADILGAAGVELLGHPDGELEDTADFRKELVRQIRLVKPDVVLTAEPYRRNMQWHRDHRIAGQVALDAVFPYARDHLHFGDLFANEGIEPHKTGAILFWGSENPNVFVDIAADFDTKLAAVMAHSTQTGRHSRDEIRGFLQARAAADAAAGNAATDDDSSGLTLAEAFRRVTFRT